MSLFSEWNSLLLEEYFSPAKAGQDVWIQTTRIELEGIGAHKGGASGLIEAVKQGPDWINSNKNIAAKANELVQQRLWPSKRPKEYCDPGQILDNYKGRNAPTYLPYIALWVLAKSETDGAGFYSTVSELIGEEFPNNVRTEMEAVWTDLNFWSVKKQEGQFGRFTLNVLGVHRYIGMAYAQSMITHKDIEGINRLFGSCRIHSGQNLNDDNFAQILDEGKRSYYLSSGLREAMGKREYKQQLRQLISGQLEFWDGYVPKSSSSDTNVQDDRCKHQFKVNDELAIILKLNIDGEKPFWEIGWRCPANVTGLSYGFRILAGGEEKAKLEFSGSHIHAVSTVNQKNAQHALYQSTSSNVEAVLIYKDSHGDCSSRKIYLRQDKVRVFVWDTPDPSLNYSLIERELPISGLAYLLYSLDTYTNLEKFLTNESIEYTTIDYDGLPENWSLICINSTETLTSDQRAKILDEQPTVIPKARIRLVGGRPITGAGSKKYAYYDLPIIELEAPADTELRSDGLTFIELLNDDSRSVRRFKCSLVDGSVYSFKIKALLGDEMLCSAGLQVLITGGLSVSNRLNFSIDNFGKSLTNTTGLLGAIVGSGKPEVLDSAFDYFSTNEDALFDNNGVDFWEFMESDISSRFLDSIATTMNGSMTFGAARDQIMRQAISLGIDDVQPVFLIRELRRRGYVEIETDVKGHMVRICSVPPTLYSLPIKDTNQRQLYGVCGSLRLQQWKELSQATEIKIFLRSESTHNFPMVRIVPLVDSAIHAIAKSANFQVVDLPAKQISQWLGSVQDIKGTLSWYHEQGFNPKYLERLNPSKGKFSAATSLAVDPKRQFELFRYEDPHIQGLRVYKLGNNSDGSLSKYSFVHDSRWGVWMAVGAFAKFVQSFGIINTKWPIHYDSLTGSLWLPARMEPPFVIERALTLCAGTGPLVIQVKGEPDGDSILLLENGLRIIGRVSRVYCEMDVGKWLCYRWVPKIIASHVASLLDGELEEFLPSAIKRKLEDTECQSV